MRVLVARDTVDFNFEEVTLKMLKSLMNTPNHDVFKSPYVVGYVNSLWKRFVCRIWALTVFNCMIAWLFINTLLTHRRLKDGEGSLPISIFTLVAMGIFLNSQVTYALKDFKGFATHDIWNWLDFLTAGLILFCASHILCDWDSVVLHVLEMVTLVLAWAKVF